MADAHLEPHSSLLVRSSVDDTAVRRACLRGDLVRLVAGRYLRRDVWDALDDAGRHVTTVLAAVSCLRTPVIVSHASAAAFWGFPRIGRWPARAHVIDPALTMPTAGRFVLRHAGAFDDGDIVVRHGTAVTSPERTALDMAVTAPFRQAVALLDHALRLDLVDVETLVQRVERRTVARGTRRARSAILFADGRANRPGESLSRVVMRKAGIAVPDLQREFRAGRGRRADVDFFWESVGVIGEFDGETKYRDSERWSGLSPEEVVIREKDRENWLRADPAVKGFVRWTWRDVLTPGTLPRLLHEAGVPHARSTS